MPATWRTYPVEQIEHKEGNAYIGRLLNKRDFPGKIVVLENGVPLGPGNVSHQAVIETGKGQFSFSQRRLLFSASDNSDPRINQKSYEVHCPILVPQFIRWSVYGVASGLILLAGLLTSAVLIPQGWGPFSPSRSQWFTGAVKVLGSPPFVTAAAVFVVVMVMQVFNYIHYFHDPEMARTGFSILGVPYTDGRGWRLMGESIAEGQGVHRVWPAFRPGYGLFLAHFYTWTGGSVALAIMLNLVLTSLSAALLCRIGEQLSNRWVGVVAALGFATQRLTLTYPLTMATETLGLFCSIASMHQLVDAVQTGRRRPFFLAGVFLGMSNLVRPLTFPAYPLYLAGILLCLGRSQPLRAIAVRATYFTAGIFLVIAPWLVRQWLTFGFVTISGNSADTLYAATSPRYGTWTGAIYNEPGYVPQSIKERYDYFMDKAKTNLREYPAFYLWNVAGSYVRCFQHLSHSSGERLSLLGLIVILGSFLFWALHFRSLKVTATVTLAFGLFSAAFIFLSRMHCPCFDLAMLVLLPLVTRKRAAVIHIVGLLGAILGIALFGMADPDERLLFMLEWCFLLTSLACVGGFCERLGQYLSGLVSTQTSTGGTNLAPLASITQTPPRWFQITLGLVLTFFAVSGVRLAVLNAVTTIPPSDPRYLTEEKTVNIVRDLDRYAPGLLRSEDMKPDRILNRVHRVIWPDAGKKEVAFPPSHNKILVLPMRLDRNVYRLPGCLVLDHWCSYFAPRDYDRTVCYFEVDGIPTPWSCHQDYPVLFPGFLPDRYSHCDCVLVCRICYHPQHRPSGEDLLYEGIALIPRDCSGNLIYEDSYLANHPEHPGTHPPTQLTKNNSGQGK